MIAEAVKLKDSYDVCAAIMKKGSLSFYQAFKQLPTKRFQAVTAVYAFCRYVDDLVDESEPADKESVYLALDQLGDAIANLFTGQALDESISALPWWTAFAHTIVTFDLQKSSFLEQIAGQKSDLIFDGFETLADLKVYCRLVAGSVGGMLCPLLVADGLSEKEEADALKACYSLGIGMQLTNILRDVGEDARERNRIYLPKAQLKAYGVSREEILSWAQETGSAPLLSQTFKDLWESLANESREHYEQVTAAIELFHPSCRLAIQAAALSYQAIEDEVRSDDYNCLTRRHYTSKKTRFAIIGKLFKKSV